MAAKKPASNWLAAVGRRDTAPREPLDEAPQDSVEQVPAESAAAVEASDAGGAKSTATDTAAVTDATSTAAAAEPASATTEDRPKANDKTTPRAPRAPRVVSDKATSSTSPASAASAAPVAPDAPAPTVAPDAPAPSTSKPGGRRKVARKAVGYRLRVPAYELIEDVYNALWEAGEEPTKDDLVSAAILAYYGPGGAGRPAGLVERTEP